MKTIAEVLAEYPDTIEFVDSKNNIWIASDVGLFRKTASGVIYPNYYDDTCIPGLRPKPKAVTKEVKRWAVVDNEGDIFSYHGTLKAAQADVHQVTKGSVIELTGTYTVPAEPKPAPKSVSGILNFGYKINDFVMALADEGGLELTKPVRVTLTEADDE